MELPDSWGFSISQVRWVTPGKNMILKTANSIGRICWRNFFQLLTHLPSFVRLFSRLLADTRVSPGAKLLVAGILAYVILPTDLLPDFLVGVGQLDDLAVILAGLKLFLKLCPPQVVQEHLRTVSARR